jgi:PAS domain S-box-containing protein
MSEMTGFSSKEAIDKPFTKFISPEYRKVVAERYRKRLRGDKISNKYEIEIVSKKGKRIPVEVNASLIEHEEKPANMAIIRDITDRKEAEKLIEEEKNRLEAIYKTVKEGLVLYDSEGRVVYMNPSVKKLFGVRKNIVGTKREQITVDKVF